jgi:hypothetical protein
MGDPGEVAPLDPPSWIGEPIGGERAQDRIEQVADWSAAGTDAAGMGGLGGPDIPGVGVSVGDGAGGVMTGVAQFRASTAQTTLGKGADAVGAGLADVGFGAGAVAAATAIGLSGGVGAAVPVVDKAVEVVADKVFGVPGMSVAATANGAIRGGVTAAEGAITGNEKGTATFTSKAETGQYGPVIKFFTGLFTGRK